MKFEGRIYKVFPVQSGTSSRGEWKRQDFLFEYFENPNDRWSDKVLLSAMNDRIDEYNIQEGDKVIIGFGHNVNEYNGRYYNELRMYHFERVAQVEKDPQPAPPQQPVQQTLFTPQTDPFAGTTNEPPF